MTTTVYELEEVRVKAGHAQDLLELSAAEVWPRTEALGSKVLAVFVPAIGPSPTAVVLTEHPDTDALAAVRFGAGLPGAGRPDLDQRDAYVVSMRSRLLVAHPGWPLRPIPADGVFTFRTFRVRPGTIGRFHQRTSEVIWPRGTEADRGGFLGLWTTAVGDVGEIAMLSRYASFAHWERTRPEADAGASDADVVAFQTARAERDEQTVSTDVVALRRLPVWPPSG